MKKSKKKKQPWAPRGLSDVEREAYWERVGILLDSGLSLSMAQITAFRQYYDRQSHKFVLVIFEFETNGGEANPQKQSEKWGELSLFGSDVGQQSRNFLDK